MRALPILRILVLCVAGVAAGGCADRPRLGIEIGSPTVKDCVPGSVSRPCD